MAERHRISSIHRRVHNPEATRPIIDKVLADHGEAAIKPFQEENMRVPLVRRKLLKAMPTLEGGSRREYKQLVVGIMPPSFKEPLSGIPTKHVTYFRDSGYGILVAILFPETALRTELAATESMRTFCPEPPEASNKFNFVIALGQLRRPLHNRYLTEFASLEIPPIDLRAGEIFFQNASDVAVGGPSPLPATPNVDET